MVGSLQIAAPTTPNPTNSLTNVSTTEGSVSGIDSAAIAVTITAEAAEHQTNDDAMRHFTSVGKDRGQQFPQKPHKTTQQSIGM
eukprot:scaffold328_cov35-Cyclotella_meneghiniana.AAC.1